MNSLNSEIERRPAQIRKKSTLLTDFVVDETIGQRIDENDDIKNIFQQIIEIVLAEFEKRLTENNEILLAFELSTNAVE